HMSPSNIDRRTFLTAASAAALFPAARAQSTADLKPVFSEIEKRHDESVRRIQEWIRQPTIAAEDKGIAEGADLMMQLLRDVGCGQVVKCPTDRHPGVFGTLDAGAPKTLAVYIMYDVKQVDPSEWSSPPFTPTLTDKAGLGKVLVGRGAVNSKGPQGAFLAAVHAIRGAGRKLPVNLIFVCESEEEIGSPNIQQIVRRPDVTAALGKCAGVLTPSATQALDGTVTLSLGAKGVIELELVSTGEKWGRGPKLDVHSSNKARLDSPAWHLVEALASLVSPDGNSILVEHYLDRVRPVSSAEKAMIDEAAKRQDEETLKRQLGVQHWVHDVSFRQSLEMLCSQPTINIEGLVGGYTGPGGKTILPHRAVAKMDLRLVPDMTAMDALAKLKAHLAKRGFGDIEVNMTGGYDPTSTSPDSLPVRVETTVYKRNGIDPIVWPRNAGSWPGYVFTGEPLKLGAIQFGFGHGSGAHAPDEYYLIESKNPKIQGVDGAVRSHVEFLYELAAAG
ncbi:MAG TPA: M20/M25/M40 family metallo-hydrolase, partial [Bryobacteraceae bacterium]|nr:M20/M25/M40 family metallo-hydrolase [Bryobacteraceae bacterium]